MSKSADLYSGLGAYLSSNYVPGDSLRFLGYTIYVIRKKNKPKEPTDFVSHGVAVLGGRSSGAANAPTVGTQRKIFAIALASTSRGAHLHRLVTGGEGLLHFSTFQVFELRF